MSGRRQDIAELASACRDGTSVQDLSGETAIFALQGPRSFDTLKGLADMAEIARLAYFTHCLASIAGIDCIVGRLGYTGELGLEIVLPRPISCGLKRALFFSRMNSAFRSRPARPGWRVMQAATATVRQRKSPSFVFEHTAPQDRFFGSRAIVRSDRITQGQSL